MAGTKSTKKDLESKIAELEEKLAKLSSQFESKPQTAAPPAPKPQVQTPPPPAPKPQTTAPPPKPAPAPKPQEAEQIAVWDQWKNAPMSDFHAYRARVTGYSPAPNRYFASKHVLSADVPTSDWNLQKAKVTGYTQPSNKYFATREKLAYHPRTKYFAGFGIKSTGGAAQTTAPPPAPAPKPAQGTLPKDAAAQTSSGNSRKDQLEEYEKQYLARLQQQQQQAKEEAKAQQAAAAKRGTLPAGYQPPKPQAQAPPPAPKPNRGTMPAGWKPS